MAVHALELGSSLHMKLGSGSGRAVTFSGHCKGCDWQVTGKTTAGMVGSAYGKHIDQLEARTCN